MIVPRIDGTSMYGGWGEFAGGAWRSDGAGCCGICARRAVGPGGRGPPAICERYVFARVVSRCEITSCACYQLSRKQTRRERGPCAPMTSDCSMSAVFEGPEMKVPKSGSANADDGAV